MPVLGYSSLGLPLWRAPWAQREHTLDLVFAAGYTCLELHIESVASDTRPGNAIIDRETRRELAAVAECVRKRGGVLVLGLGARYLLGPRKHEPSLIHSDPEGRRLRLQLIHEAIEQAADLGSSLIIFLSGAAEGGVASQKGCHQSSKYQGRHWAHFEEAIERLLTKAEARRVVLAPEAHSAHLFANITDMNYLRGRFSSPFLGFTADSAHQTVTEDEPLRNLYRALAGAITHVQLDNLASRPSGIGSSLSKTALDSQGAVDVAGAVAGLLEGGYRGALSVEFLRGDHPEVEPHSYCRRTGEWLARLCAEV